MKRYKLYYCYSDTYIEVVSLGTGSKCIGPKRMDKDGKLVSELTVLYPQLLMSRLDSK